MVNQEIRTWGFVLTSDEANFANRKMSTGHCQPSQSAVILILMIVGCIVLYKIGPADAAPPGTSAELQSSSSIRTVENTTLPDMSLYVVIDDPDEGEASQRDTTDVTASLDLPVQAIISNGKLDPMFSCSKAPLRAKESAAQLDTGMDIEDGVSCFTVGPYSAKSEFLFEFNDPLLDFSQKPTATTRTRALTVAVDNMIEDGDDFTGGFVAYFYCLRDDIHPSIASIDMVVEFEMDVGENYPLLRFSVVKTCRFGELDYLKINDQHSWTELEQTVLADDVGLTTLDLTLIPPATSVLLEQPLITTNAPSALIVGMRGSISGEYLTRAEPLHIDVFYECVKPVKEAIVNLTIPVAPFRSITRTWKKNCDAAERDMFASLRHKNAADMQENQNSDTRKKPLAVDVRVAKVYSSIQALKVGTHPMSTADVAENGKVTLRYQLPVNSFGNPSFMPSGLRVLEAHQNAFEVYLWNDKRVGAVKIDRIILSVDNTRVLHVRFYKSAAFRQYYMDTSGGELDGTIRQLGLSMVCKAEGQAKVLITLMFERGHKLEFGFGKVCDAPRIHRRHQRALQAASSVMWTIVICAGLVFIVVLWRTVLTIRFDNLDQEQKDRPDFISRAIPAFRRHFR